jgi:hypothetical protein
MRPCRFALFAPLRLKIALEERKSRFGVRINGNWKYYVSILEQKEKKSMRRRA